MSRQHIILSPTGDFLYHQTVTSKPFAKKGYSFTRLALGKAHQVVMGKSFRGIRYFAQKLSLARKKVLNEHPAIATTFHSFLANSSPTPALANKPAQARLNKRRMAGRENQWLKKLPA
tara:strand:+ start:2484 stop:2837 length:354 start_codon:yes stop_codon:yes gene_type:complete